MSDLTKKTDVAGVQKTGSGIKINSTAGASPLHQRLNQAKAIQNNPANDPLAKVHRIGLMLDVSGSMNWTENGDTKSKIQHLKDAVDGFVAALNPNDTAAAVETFPERVSQQLSSDVSQLMLMGMGLSAGGGTPMSSAMNHLIDSSPITRGIIVSDGDADSSHAALEAAAKFANAEIPIDCVHIGSSTGGESLLKEIAARTGGIYIKFTNVQNFAQAMSYLSPVKRAALAAKNKEVLRLIGATEIQ